MSTARMDPSIDDLLKFYIDRNPMDWFMTPKGFDEELRTRFGSLVGDARASKLESWRETPRGSLAMIILLDQIPRNIFRKSGESFSSDNKALAVAKDSVANGFDEEIGKTNKIAQFLFYLPYEHAEDLSAQTEGVALFKNLDASCEDGTEAKKFTTQAVESAQDHYNVVAKFGRFPKRNEALSRKTTPEEEEFLKEHPRGF